MTDTLAPFLGTWILDVEESDFQHGEPPRSATLRIEDEFGMVRFTMSQVTSDGETVTDSFSALPDGPETPLGKSGLVDAMRLVFQGPRNLVSEARRGGVTLMKADRELSEDGRTLTVTQTVHVPDVASYTNVSLYRRAH
ncbi:hypothetical protein [Polymorphum gilvum]|uniref:Lipocalin-like domain-containing protein n=1 Tax=Polymorphum gilvum (strain LMG 25793 / CGMCC 1.9160 / SL003B-26A1) TaxID=991905 RepID=F2J240_POLGS|nr:hypothetical protein [Polymorphum gilvum]ADZ68799.1 hypothetical protein SL003B_0364 [Polymorphum gilvum SL003B-26A1]